MDNITVDNTSMEEKINTTLDSNYKIWKKMVTLYPGHIPPVEYYHCRQMVRDMRLKHMQQQEQSNVANNN